jgi:hypothetical protein
MYYEVMRRCSEGTQVRRDELEVGFSVGPSPRLVRRYCS